MRSSVTNIQSDMKVRTDECKTEMLGKIRVAPLKSGGRRLVHPSGYEVIETAAIINRRIEEAEVLVTEAQAELVKMRAVKTALAVARIAASSTMKGT